MSCIALNPTISVIDDVFTLYMYVPVLTTSWQRRKDSWPETYSLLMPTAMYLTVPLTVRCCIDNISFSKITQ